MLVLIIIVQVCVESHELLLYWVLVAIIHAVCQIFLASSLLSWLLVVE